MDIAWQELETENLDWHDLPPQRVTVNCDHRSLVTARDLRSAYRQELMRWHPDRLPPAEHAIAAEHVQRLTVAYKNLQRQLAATEDASQS